jgi:PAS domain S-box-containing protein
MVRHVLNETAPGPAPYLPLVLAVTVPACLGGLKPGLLALALSLTFVLLSPSVGAGPDAASRRSVDAALFVATGATICVLCEALHRGRRRRVEELETVLSAAPAAIWIAHDQECRRITGNRTASEILRMPQGDNLSVSAPEAERPTHFRVFRNGAELRPEEMPMQRAARGMETRDFEEETVFTDGTRRRLYGSAIPLRGPDGAPRGAVGAFVDITDLKRTEEELRRAKQHLSIVTDAMAVAVAHCSRDLRYLWVSRSCEELLGLPAERIIGRPIVEIVGAEAFARLRPYVERVLAGERVAYEEELNYVTVGRRWISAVYTPTYGTAGDAPDGWVAVVLDIDHRKRAEEALREADRRKDNFLATLAHELRNPLVPIRNAVEVLRLKGPAEPESQTAREMIDRQVHQMVHLIEDLLDVSRINRNKLKLRREPVELGALLRHAVEPVRPLIDASGHQFTMALPPETIGLDADPVRLVQVFSNLLHNAVKYTERGGQIRLTAERRGSEVLVSVRDTGIGIPREHLPRMFQMFSQVAPALERSQSGLGIGLWLVRALTELHGGHVEARSEGPGHGSEFIVHLPVVELPAAPPRPAEVPAPVPARRCRVLVADDHQDNADSLGMMLRVMGHEVRTAHDGYEAVQAAAAFRPEVALLDIGMPKMNGFEAARHIRERPWGREIALIAMTGWGQEEDRRRSLEAGFDQHVVKPVDPHRLQGLLVACLAQRRSPAPPPPPD